MPTHRHPAANGGKWIRPEKRLAIYLRDQFRCAYCDRNLVNAAPAQRSLDHVIPISDGGNNAADNLLTCCKNCNDRKGKTRIWHFVATQIPLGPECEITYALRNARIIAQLQTPLNIPLAKAILAGTLDLSEALQ